jgi:hypothetical protein
MKRIPARGTAVVREGIKEIAGLTAPLPVAGRDRPVLALNIETDKGSRPVQGVWDHNTSSLARPWGSCECNALLAIEHQESLTGPAQDDAAFAEKTCPADLSSRSEPSIPMERSTSREKECPGREDNYGKRKSEGAKEMPPHVLTLAVVVAVPERSQWGSMPRIVMDRPEKEEPGKIGSRDGRRGASYRHFEHAR